MSESGSEREHTTEHAKGRQGTSDNEQEPGYDQGHDDARSEPHRRDEIPTVERWRPPDHAGEPGFPPGDPNPPGPSLAPRGQLGQPQDARHVDRPNGEIVEYHHRGPLPDPFTLDAYDQIVPGSAARMMDEALADTRQDRENNAAAVRGAIRYENWSLALAFCVVVLSIAGVFICLALLDPPESIAGATVCGLGAAGPIVANLLRRDRKEPPTAPPGPETGGGDAAA